WLEQDLRVEAAREAWLTGRAIPTLERRFAVWQTPAAADVLRQTLFALPTDPEVAELAQVLTDMGVNPAFARQLVMMTPWRYVNAKRAPGSDPVVFATSKAHLIVP